MKRNTMQEKMLYEHIQQNYPENLIGNNIRWNFTKFLVDRNGKIIARFEPDDSMVDLEEQLKALL